MKRDEPVPVARRALGITEAAKAVGVSRSSIYRLLATGQLQGVKIGARRLIRTEALDALLGANQAAK
jgi:excisionase family DNA binding protein